MTEGGNCRSRGKPDWGSQTPKQVKDKWKKIYRGQQKTTQREKDNVRRRKIGDMSSKTLIKKDLGSLNNAFLLFKKTKTHWRPCEQ